MQQCRKELQIRYCEIIITDELLMFANFNVHQKPKSNKMKLLMKP